MQTYTLSQINELPTTYGVYYFLDDQDRLMYIGKSLNLKKRVKSYFYSKEHHPKIIRMLTFVDKIKIQTTDTHLEAKLLEYEEILSNQPDYNRQFKRDRALMELVFKPNSDKFITWDYHDQQLSIEEKIVMPKTHVLDSFAEELYYYLSIIKNVDSYKINRQVIPIKLNKSDKQEQIQMLLKILSYEEEFSNFQNSLQTKMQEIAINLQFELASKYRDFDQQLNYFKRWLFDVPKLLQEGRVYTLDSVHGQKQVFIKDLILSENPDTPSIISKLDSQDKIQIVYTELIGIEAEESDE